MQAIKPIEKEGRPCTDTLVRFFDPDPLRKEFANQSTLLRAAKPSTPVTPAINITGTGLQAAISFVG
jgi:hypothetical protein